MKTINRIEPADKGTNPNKTGHGHHPEPSHYSMKDLETVLGDCVTGPQRMMTDEDKIRFESMRGITRCGGEETAGNAQRMDRPEENAGVEVTKDADRDQPMEVTKDADRDQPMATSTEMDQKATTSGIKGSEDDHLHSAQ